MSTEERPGSLGVIKSPSVDAENEYEDVEEDSGMLMDMEECRE